jgi:hypothetical protein
VDGLEVLSVPLAAPADTYLQHWRACLQHNCGNAPNLLGIASQFTDRPELSDVRAFFNPGERCYPVFADFLPRRVIQHFFENRDTCNGLVAGVLQAHHVPALDHPWGPSSGAEKLGAFTMLGDGLVFALVLDDRDINYGALMFALMGSSRGECLVLT